MDSGIVEDNSLEPGFIQESIEEENSTSQDLAKESEDDKSDESNNSEAGYESDSEDETFGEIDDLLEDGLDIDQLKKGVKRKSDDVPEHEEKERIILVSK